MVGMARCAVRGHRSAMSLPAAFALRLRLPALVVSARGGAAAAAAHIRSAWLLAGAALFSRTIAGGRAGWFAVFLRHNFCRLICGDIFRDTYRAIEFADSTDRSFGRR